MRPLVLFLAVLTAACTGGQSSDAYVEMDTGGLYTSVVEYLHSTESLSESDLAYVVEPSPSEWLNYCGTKDSPDSEAAAAVGKPCEDFWSIDDDAQFEYTSAAKSEIKEAFSPASVKWVSNRTDALEPLGDGSPPRPVNDDAELISFGVALEVDGMIYLPVNMHDSGILVEATPTVSGWVIDGLMHWQA